MKIVTLVASFFFIVAALFLLDASPANSEPCYFYEDGESILVEDCSEIRITGHSKGNHELDCTVIRPWNNDADPDPRDVPYPVIGWANGWNFGNVVGEHTTEGYKPGLIEWALDGPYIVVAANQWSVQEGDVLACVQWVIDHYPEVDGSKIGLAGHSQGGGAVIKAGDGEPNGLTITAVVAMNPYGPAWVNPENQDGPLMLLGGDGDTTTPTSSFIEVLHAVEAGQGGLLAELIGGTHNSEAWGVDEEGNTLGWEEAQEMNFGEYQRVTELWWDFHLNDRSASERRLNQVLDRGPWIIY